MNGEDILTALNGVEPELLNTAYKKPAVTRKAKLRWIAAAAALAVICGCATAGAISYSKGRFAPITTGTHGYNALFELKRFAWSDFHGDIAEAPEAIRQQYAAFTPQPAYSSFAASPGTWSKSFASLSEAADYVGLRELKVTSLPFKPTVLDSVFGVTGSAKPVLVSAYGDEDGNIGEIQIFANHIVTPDAPADARIGGALRIEILTENSDRSTVNSGGDWGDYDPGTIGYEEFVTSKGKLCQYAHVGIGEGKTRELVVGYVVDSGILYSLSVNFDPGMYEQVLGLIKTWAEEF